MTTDQIISLIREVFNGISVYPTTYDKTAWRLEIHPEFRDLKIYTYSKFPETREDSIWYINLWLNGHSHDIQIIEGKERQVLEIFKEKFMKALPHIIEGQRFTKDLIDLRHKMDKGQFGSIWRDKILGDLPIH